MNLKKFESKEVEDELAFDDTEGKGGEEGQQCQGAFWQVNHLTPTKNEDTNFDVFFLNQNYSTTRSRLQLIANI